MAGLHKSISPTSQENCIQMQVKSSAVGAGAAASGNQEKE